MTSCTMATVGLVALVLLVCVTDGLAASGSSNPLRRPFIQGIVVPKRSALIMGLNQQFKIKSSSTVAPFTNSTNSETLITSVITSSTPRTLTNLIGSSWLTRGTHNNQQKQQEQQQQHQNRPARLVGSSDLLAAPVNKPTSSLYLDKQQQQLLAANPELLNPAANLLTRSDAPNNRPSSQTGGHHLSAIEPFPATTSDPPSASVETGSQAQYKGFSLIELEVRGEADRMHINELYANLSAVLDDQAKRQSTFGVSPYVDIDFWSLRQSPNELVDIMVSPKSRAFVIGQANRFKIRHRIKIDDIQARLDAQMAPSPSPQSASHLVGQTNLAKTAGDELSGRTTPVNGRQGPPNGNESSGSASGNNNSSNNNGHDSNQNHHQEARAPFNESAFFENYQRLGDINHFLETLVDKNSDIARVRVIGRSSQGRYLRVLTLGYEQIDENGLTDGLLEPDSGDELNVSPTQGGINTPRRQPSLNNATLILANFFRRQMMVQKLGSIWLDGGTHAREWISPSTVLYIASRLADNHNRCRRFFDNLRVAVSTFDLQQQQLRQLHQQQQQNRSSRQFNPSEVTYPSTPGSKLPTASSSLDADLVNGINEINSELLGKPTTASRPQTDLERSLEALARNPTEFAKENKCDLELDQILRRYTFFMMPVLNPDGYEYSHTHNRLWRKTRSTSNHPIYRHFCLGVDPNRNYDARHGATGSSTHPCSQTFAGNTPFTEPETRHQSNFVYANRLNMKMFISFHSYSQMILLPYSHSKHLAPDHKDLESVGLAAVKAIEQVHGTAYKVGPSASILYTASGTASDWAYEKAGIKYSYTIELRDTGAYGFLLPRQQIVPTGEETFNGLLAMINQMEKNENQVTSKSFLAGTHQGGQLNHTRLIELNRIPNSDKLLAISALNKQPKPLLENALDGSDTWAAPQQVPSSVRDRPVPVHHHNSGDSGDLLAQPFSAHKIEDRVVEESPSDAGYAFEGEGELMEPTRENILEAAKMNEIRLMGRQDYSRRIVKAAGVTSSGRSFVNSPLATRTTTLIPRRELSDDMPEKLSL